MSELKGCPFCSKEAEYMDTGPSMERSVNLNKAYCRCSDRNCSGAKIYFLVEDWNTRAVPEGMVMVPLEPTEKMINTAAKTIIADWADPTEIYKAMLDAAKGEDDV